MTKLTAYFIAQCFHFLFDFIFQGTDIATKKRFFNQHMLTHGIVMGFTAAFSAWLYYHSLYSLIGSFIWVFATHILIDAFRVELNRKFTKGPSSLIFWQLLGLDQLLHALALYTIFLVF